MNLITVLECITAYLFAGAILHGIVIDECDDPAYVAILFWPIAIIIWIGDELGQSIKRFFNQKKRKMKTDIDPIFEQKDNREFGKRLSKELPVVIFCGIILGIVVIFISILIGLILQHAEVIDRVKPEILCLIILLVFLQWLFASWVLKQIEDFKHNDQR